LLKNNILRSVVTRTFYVCFMDEYTLVDTNVFLKILKYFA